MHFRKFHLAVFVVFPLVMSVVGCGGRESGNAVERGPVPTAGARKTVAATVPTITSGQADVSGLTVPEGMAVVPSGPFFRGCSNGYNGIRDEKCAGSEMPAGSVTTRTYFIDRNEVTVERYTKCVKAGACPEPVSAGDCNFGHAERPTYPINCVTWDDARRFCAWEGKRLPTEAEWEKAARGTDGRRYPWGNEEPDADGTYRANWGDGLTKWLWVRDHWEYDAPVGSFAEWASPYGCNDMAGNVAEWVADFWAPNYDGLPADDPKGPAAGDQRVVRGGSFREYRQRIRTSARIYHQPEFVDDNVGFRCAEDLKK